jgi:methyl-accepting chemotaxis protein
MAGIDRIILFLVSCVSVLIAAGFVAAYFLGRAMARPLRNVAGALQDISEGEGDLTKRLNIQSKDEIGEMTGCFNRMLDKIQNLIIDLKEKAFSLAALGEDVASSAKEISATAHEQSASVSEILSTMEGSRQLSEQMALRTEEVARLSVDTQTFSQKGVELRDANERMMGDIQNQNGKIIHEIKNLVDMIRHINDAIRIIDGIADQTKLIAFNAALEASSSGESGARFSVVAGEIRRFADNVVASTQGIKLRIAEVQTASAGLISEAMKGSQKIAEGYEHLIAQKAVFEGIVETAQNVASRSAQISNLSKQQEYATAQVFQALREISAGVTQFAGATASSSKTTDTLNAISQDLQQAIIKYRVRPQGI